jgi:hypothetical protein
MSIMTAIKRGSAAVLSAYNQQKRDAEDRAKRRMANAKTKLERERAKLVLEREKVALQRELADAKLALARDKSTLAKERAALRGPSRISGVSKGLSSGFKSFAKWYDQGMAPPKRRISVKKKVTTRKGK